MTTATLNKDCKRRCNKLRTFKLHINFVNSKAIEHKYIGSTKEAHSRTDITVLHPSYQPQ